MMPCLMSLSVCWQRRLIWVVSSSQVPGHLALLCGLQYGLDAVSFFAVGLVASLLGLHLCGFLLLIFLRDFFELLDQSC